MRQNGNDHQGFFMKRIFTARMVVATTFLTVIFFALFPHFHLAQAEPAIEIQPGSSYNRNWRRVDSLADAGLYRSAEELAGLILEKAKREKNDGQIVKALMCKFKMGGRYKEHNDVSSIYEMEAELKNAKFPLTAIMHSMLGEMYWNYYNRDQYEILARTKTLDFENDSIDTWDISKLVDHSMKNYKWSLENADSLKKIPVGLFDAVIEKGDAPKELRPTLYDFLVYRAIGFFSGDEPAITQPADHFAIDKQEFFSDARDFVKQDIKTATDDTVAFGYYALNLYREWLSFHLKDTSALIAADRDRLQFVYNSYSGNGNDSLYATSLRNLADQFPKSKYSADVLYQLALFYDGLGSEYTPYTNEKDRWKEKEAFDLCNTIIKKFPGTNGEHNSRILKADIAKQDISFNIENVAIPNQPFPGLVSVQNVDSVFFRIVKIPEGSSADGFYDDSCINLYLKMPIVQQWQIKIPLDGDYQQHSAQIKFPALAAGSYVVFASNRKDFPVDTSISKLAYQQIDVSSISYMYSENDDGGTEFLFVNRATGEPLTGAKVRRWDNKYNRKKDESEWKEGKKYSTDKNGAVSISATKKESNDFYLEVEWKGNKLKTETFDNYSNYEETYADNKNTETEVNTFFFTDRSIYRPGQTVFFKGIMLEKEGTQSHIMTNKTTTVSFLDVNEQTIKSLDLVTNDFGSFSGSFVIPNNGVTGYMHIENGSGEQSFSVEEYKRPEFDITFNQVAEQIRLGEKIQIAGTAKTFSGAPLDQASVKFSVSRNSDYYYRHYSSGGNAEIASGTINTNDTGGFVFSFMALPDPADQIAANRRYDFSISVDVTDISGETHSAEKQINISNESLGISTSITDELVKGIPDSIYVTTENADYFDIPSDVDFKIYKVQQPTQTFRERRWERPDKFICKKDEWDKWFPEDIYDNEDDQTTWLRQEMVFEKKFNTGKISHFGVDGKDNWKTGTYAYEGISHDKSGKEIKTEGYFTMTDRKEKKLAVPQAWTSFQFNPENFPADKNNIRCGTSLDGVNVYCEIERDEKVFSRTWMKMDNETKDIQLPDAQQIKGDYYVHFIVVHNNRVYTSEQYISAPVENTDDLDITYETFRDKLIPGQPEEWKLKVKGPKGEKVMAEMMAEMYDESLDQFESHDWYFNPFDEPEIGEKEWSGNVSDVSGSLLYYYYDHDDEITITPEYDRLNWYGYLGGWYDGNYYADYSGENPDSTSVGSMKLDSLRKADGYVTVEDSVAYTEPFRGNVFHAYDELRELKAAPGAIRNKSAGGDPEFTEFYSVHAVDANGATNDVAISGNTTGYAYNWSFDGGKSGENRMVRMEDGPNLPLKNVKSRKNLNETVFFYPQLQTDSSGSVIIKFTMGEALTKWKFMAFAHTKDLKYGMTERDVVTQKDLMVMPNAPRFLREGDKITFTAKVANLGTNDLSGNAQLQLFDALTMEPVDAKFSNTKATIPFTTKIGQSAGLSWDLQIPEGINAIVYKVVASAGNFSDGEENALPVLSNRMLVTETMPISIRGGQTKNFTFDKLINQNNGSTTLRNEKLTLEFTSNPAWYAVQALPYMMEYPYECAEQTFDRFYANSLATDIANSNPKIRNVFDAWKNKSPDAFLGSLEKNDDLKNVVLTETPWVLDAKDESERKRRVGLLFDVNHMADETGRASSKLHLMQAGDGGWPWFEGMPDDRYITQYIISGFGHLENLQVGNAQQMENDSEMIASGVRYMDRNMRKDYENILKYDKPTMDLDHLDYMTVQYLYARSFFRKMDMNPIDTAAFDYFFGQAKKYWTHENLYMKGMIALALSRYDEKKVSHDIMKSIKETALHSDEMGMYWKENSGGFYWYEASVETQSLLIEAFKEVENDQQSVDDMRLWLLKNKQTNQWNTTKSTADACYALLLDGTSWLSTASDVSILVGTQTVDPNKSDVSEEAGTGYFKTSWSGAEIQPAMGNVKVSKPGTGVSWGSIYWQYFEDIDKITPAQTPLTVSKKLFLQKMTAAGLVMEPVTSTTVLHPGDKLTVRVELRVDRDMEYVHMKDMRASGFEPVNVLSQYKYQDGLGYYESTKDASTDFFFSELPKGVHVFEYPLTVIHAGDFSEGITEVQCMYAPEFSAHSEGMRVQVSK